ncbi:MAG: type II toxin-antitoxin system RelE/ParE family toxin [Clostridia bacterium]|nr:type II toxin-antitoxin system RelE/ParE family toxin [Clostridia bacterium]
MVRGDRRGILSRVLYFFFDGGQAILTHGFIKKTQKTPPSEIERAIRYKFDSLLREFTANPG